MNNDTIKSASSAQDIASTTNAVENINLTYDYTENCIKSQKDDAKHLDWRLGTFLGFAGLLLRFNSNLATEQSILLLSTKVLIVAISLLSIVYAAQGLTSISKVGQISPKSLMKNEYLAKTNTRIKTIAININMEVIDELDLLILRKQFCLNRSIFLLTIGALVFGASIILNAYFKYKS